MAKYIRCSYCGKRIDIGTEVCACSDVICCDAFCLASVFARFEVLSESKARANGHEVFDDADRIRELKEEIPKREKELMLMKLELAGFEHPYFD